MQRDQAAVATERGSDTGGRQAPEASRLGGPWLAVVRVVWVLFYLLNLVWFVLALVEQVNALEHPCSGPTCLLTPAQAQTLHQLGISLTAFAAFNVGIPTPVVVAGALMALLLYLRRPDDPMALFVGLFLIYPINTFANSPNNVEVLLVTAPLALADGTILYAVLLLFPDGRFVPRWSWLLLAAWAILELLEAIGELIVVTHTQLSPQFVDAGNVLGATYPLLYLSALAVQIYRFRRVSTARQRQQTKWVILGIAVFIGANIAYWIVLPEVVPAWQQPGSLYDLVGERGYELVTLALPLSFALAIQRHQLFDVDVLIKRTLVYGTLTVILAALYFSVVIGAQAAVGMVDPQASQSPVIVVATTLLIAALFTPVRRGLQTGIDRRFYRRKYDAARTLQAFAATLRTTTDLRELSDDLLAVVRETMQPEHVSLWLRAPARQPEIGRATTSTGERIP